MKPQGGSCMSAQRKAQGPEFTKLFSPVIEALRELGFSASAKEVRDKVAEIVKATDEERAEVLKNGQSKFNNKVDWARFYLAKYGYIQITQRGVWTLTDLGKKVDLSKLDRIALFKAVRELLSKEENTNEKVDAPEIEVVDGTHLETHRDKVYRMFMSLTPKGFERFAQRILRESGFEDVSVTGRTGDGGIDGFGWLRLNRLYSYKVLFQCKRYSAKQSIGRDAISSFQGTITGRADKGIFITTSYFTTSAREEARRDGAIQIELIDLERLISICEDLELGLKSNEYFSIDEDFFKQFND
jgi:restriction system protein